MPKYTKKDQIGCLFMTIFASLVTIGIAGTVGYVIFLLIKILHNFAFPGS